MKKLGEVGTSIVIFQEPEGEVGVFSVCGVVRQRQGP